LSTGHPSPGKLLSTDSDSVSAEIRRIRQFVTGQLGDIRKLLHTDVLQAKLELEKHIKAIRMVPKTDGKKGHYVAEGEWNLLGGYGSDANLADPHFCLVAGERVVSKVLTLPFRLELVQCSEKASA
jgi:hypothetical protein